MDVLELQWTPLVVSPLVEKLRYGDALSTVLQQVLPLLGETFV